MWPNSHLNDLLTLLTPIRIFVMVVSLTTEGNGITEPTRLGLHAMSAQERCLRRTWVVYSGPGAPRGRSDWVS